MFDRGNTCLNHIVLLIKGIHMPIYRNCIIEYGLKSGRKITLLSSCPIKTDKVAEYAEIIDIDLHAIK